MKNLATSILNELTISNNWNEDLAGSIFSYIDKINKKLETLKDKKGIKNLHLNVTTGRCIKFAPEGVHNRSLTLYIILQNSKVTLQLREYTQCNTIKYTLDIARDLLLENQILSAIVGEELNKLINNLHEEIKKHTERLINSLNEVSKLL